ncbi:hypothetical protein H6H01_01930 [Nostoc calcicola FACHB-3891]|nr:hypothetical protein [Nostoc calcicola FACHB-3891]
MTTATLQFIDDKITEKKSLLEEIDQLDREIKAAQEIEFDLTTALNSLSSIFNKANPLILDEVKKAIAFKCSELGILNGEVKEEEEIKKPRKHKKTKDNLTTSLDKIDELLDKNKTSPLSPEEVKEFNQSVEVASEQLSEELPASQVEEFTNNLITELNTTVVEVLEPEFEVNHSDKVDELLEKNKTSKLSPEELNEFGRSLDAILEEVDRNYTQQELEDSVQAIADIDVQAQVVESVVQTIEEPKPVVETKPVTFSMASFFSQPIKVSEAAIALDDMETGTEVQHTLTGVVGVIDRSEPIGTLPVQMEGIRSGLVPVMFAGGKSAIPISELEILPIGAKVKHRSSTLGEVCDRSKMPKDIKQNNPKAIIPIKFIDDVLDNWYSWQEPIHLEPMSEEEVQTHLEKERAKLEEIRKGDPF